MANILSIAGSDPSRQAGIQGDLEVIREFGHRGLTVITAVTAQNDQRVYSVNPVDTKILKDQLSALLSEFKFDAVKIGLLVSREITYQVYRILEESKIPNIVVDPVMNSSSGTILLESGAVPLFSSFLLPLAKIVTPNLDEAEQLSGLKVRSVDTMAQAAHKIYKEAPGLEAVLVKGGHLNESKVDVLFYNNEIYEFAAQSFFADNARGTGCALSTALACSLADGYTIPESVHQSKAFLEKFIPRRV
jgi:hydroxymethylpyrimidine/phosphomethylpyrimidine kinase